MCEQAWLVAHMYSVAMPAAHDVWPVLKILEDGHALWVQQVRAHAERLSYHDWELIMLRASAERLSFHDWQCILGRMHNNAFGPRESAWALSAIAPTLVMRSPTLWLRGLRLPSEQ